MQHRDRARLTSGIHRLVADVYGLDDCGDRRAHLACGLQPLLDSFLHEAQPLREGEVTILLADIRGFTALTRSLAPALTARLLNRFFSVMCEVIARHRGVVDKFIGDAILALFGVPEPRPDDLARALACAVEMQQAMALVNHGADARAEPRLYTGIAINTGRVMMGSFGSALHSEYTVIGDAVNLVARIESFTLRGQVLLSDATRTAAGTLVDTGRVNEVRVKGVPKPVLLHDLLSVNGLQPVLVPRVETRRSPRIGVDLAALFHRVDAKRILPGGIPGRVHDLGYEGMRADLPMPLPALAEVLITLTPPLVEAPPSTDGAHRDDTGIYARVLRSHATGDGFRTSLAFTSMDTPGHRRLKHMVDDALWRR
jgi:adenylate cyclase